MKALNSNQEQKKTTAKSLFRTSKINGKSNSSVLIAIFLTSFLTFGQKLVLNNNAFLVISNGGKLVISDSLPSAISTSGTGGNIVSEGELNQVVWQIGSSTGAYTIPFTTKPAVIGGNGTKIPLTVTITSAGDAAGSILFSTYETTTDYNIPYPTGVTSLNQENNTDGSLFTIDRFWIMNNSSYSTKPVATLLFAYDESTNELGGLNTISETGLKAQRWNSSVNSWESLSFGSVNITSNTVSEVNASDFWEIWTLQSGSTLLDVHLTEFDYHTSEDCAFFMEWKCPELKDISAFLVEKSRDATEWYGETSIPSSSSATGNFNYHDPATSEGISYYKLSSVDYDGIIEKLAIVSNKNDCFDDQLKIVPNPFSRSIQIYCPASGRLLVVSGVGKTLSEHLLMEGVNSIDLQNLPPGTYYATFLFDNESVKTLKIMKL